MSREILVFADWEEFEKPMLIGILRSDIVKGVEIKNKVLASVRNWETVATNIGLNRAEQQIMRPAFNV